MAVTLDLGAGRHRPVGEHHIEPVHGEIGEQGLQTSFLADEAHGLGQFEHRRQQAVRDELRDDVCNADAQGDEAFFGAVFQHVLELRPRLKNLFGVGEGELAGFSQLEPTAGAVKEGNADAFLELRDLPGQRLRRQMQALGSAHDTTEAGDAVEIVQVLVVDHGFPPPIYFVFFDNCADFYLFAAKS